jgi:uncharacterized protein (TIGR01777 family)
MTERIVVTGGTGYVGGALIERLAEGREIVVLTRGEALPESLARFPSVSAATWDARTLGPWSLAVDGASAVVHLAGAQAVGVRHTESVKQRLWDSRVKSAEVLVTAIERAKKRPRVFVSASGVDYYPGGLSDEPYDESSAAGDGFLSRLCVAWEDAARAAERFGVRVVSMRSGVVFGDGDGPLATMALPFKLFVGGPLGSGEQVFSWVHRNDAVSAYVRCLDDDSFSGAVNVVAPEAPKQAELARAIGRALHRPAFFPAPGFVLRTLFGEGALPILLGRHVVPKRLEEAGFRFEFPTLEPALAEAFGRR